MDVKGNEAEWIWQIPELKFCDSYSRMRAVIGLYGIMAPEKWWRVLGYEWPSCDNIGEYTSWLGPKFRQCSRLRLNMMDRDQRIAYDALPDVLMVYRGCYDNNRFGMSWTLDKGVAAQFPTLNRYRQNNKPLLLSVSIPKSECVYLGDEREEREIVTASSGLWRADVMPL